MIKKFRMVKTRMILREKAILEILPKTYFYVSEHATISPLRKKSYFSCGKGGTVSPLCRHVRSSP